MSSVSFGEQDESYVLGGKVENVTQQELAHIRVSANFYDEDNTLVFERWDAVPFLNPGQTYLLRIPYVADNADAAPTEVDRYELTTNVRQTPLTPKNNEEVDVRSHSLGEIEEGLGVRGELKNLTDTTLTRVYPIVNFHDGDGNVISTYKDGASDLAPDTTVPFEVPYLGRYRPPSNAVEGYELTVTVQR